jgi:hypothetical protein
MKFVQMMRVMDKLKVKKCGDRGDSSRSRSTRGSGGGDTSSLLFQVFNLFYFILFSSTYVIVLSPYFRVLDISHC